MSVSYPETPPPILPPGKQVNVPVAPVEDIEEEEFDGGPGQLDESVTGSPDPDAGQPEAVTPAGQGADTSEGSDSGASEGQAPGGEPSDEGQDGAAVTEAANGEDTAP